MSVFLSFTVLGVVFGAVYGLLAIGLVVTYNTTGVFNFAQGAVGMVARSRTGNCGRTSIGRSLAIAFIVFVEAPLLGLLVEFVLFRRIHGATVERSLMVSLGLMVILLGVATIFWSSPDVIRAVPPYFTQSNGTVLAVQLFGSNGVTLQYQQIMIVVVTAFVGVALPCSSVAPARCRHASRGRRPRTGRAGRCQAASDVADGLGSRLHAGRVGGRPDRPTRRAEGVDLDPANPLGPERVRRRGRGAVAQPPHGVRRRADPRPHRLLRPGVLPGHINAGLASVLTEVIPVVFLFVVLLVIPAARLAPAGRLAVRAVPSGAARQSAAGAVLLVAVMVVLAVMVGTTAMTTLSQGLALGIVGLSLVLLVGFAGQVPSAS